MRRLVVLVAMGVGLLSLAVIACGGPEVPPLTPDTLEPPPTGETHEAGAPAN